MSKTDTWTPVTLPFAVGVLAQSEQQAVADRVQVGREAGDLQLAQDLRGAREVQEVERVGLPEGHDGRDVAEVAHRLDLLGAAQALDTAGLHEPTALLDELDHHRRALALLVAGPRRLPRGGHPQRAVVARERPPTQDVAVDASGADVAGLRRRRGVERVQLGRDLVDAVAAAAGCDPALERHDGADRAPPAGGDVEPVRRGVDEVPVGRDRGAVGRREALAGSQRRDEQRADAGRGAGVEGPVAGDGVPALQDGAVRRRAHDLRQDVGQGHLRRPRPVGAQRLVLVPGRPVLHGVRHGLRPGRRDEPDRAVDEPRADVLRVVGGLLDQARLVTGEVEQQHAGGRRAGVVDHRPGHVVGQGVAAGGAALR